MTIVEAEKLNQKGLQKVAANERFTFFGLTLPYLIMVTALIVIPVGWLFYLSFIGRDGSFSFENYERMMKSKAYIRIFITCLLYTSPSPRDATLSRMPSSA